MKTTHKLALGVSAVLVAGTVTAIVLNRVRKKKLIAEINEILDGGKPAPADGSQVVIPKNEYEKLPIGNFPLKYGDKNKKVFALQKALNSRYGTKLDIDGKFGAGTYSALCKNYFSVCAPVIESVYLTATRREVTQANFDEITTKKATTT